MSELKYANASDEEVMEKIRERIREMKQLLGEIRDMLKVR
ncbi:hypothetical protein Cmaq_1563 [Caldivirga maquilingensis IC-167]|uniref:Uncharacterized protein n=1 Tax=Caldivirga maquilingensis (strain ATCC 700844 / DSM 13496 / JCM 10307 / IC-167) TaxID=397948 RepID=A8M9G7_CALMQ|nr:hypothetical protein Cmaq_1563 [Caldivirga maquilingensis IC-167]